MLGPKPKPTRLKLVTGNQGRRPLNDQEAKPRTVIPDPPDMLKDEALAEWHRITLLLAEVGLIAKLDYLQWLGVDCLWLLPFYPSPLRDGGYDAVIADIRLPDMTGYEFYVRLREIMEPVPMILMTGFGYDPGHSIVKARQAGLQAVLFKPFRLDQLLSTVEQVVSAPGPLAKS